MRLKGQASFRPLGKKAAFKVKFPEANRLLGLKSMTLNNMVQDASMVHETLGCRQAARRDRGQVAGTTAARLRPRGLTLHSRRSGRRLKLWGTLRLPRGTGRAGVCGGRVTLRVSAGRKRLATRRTALRYDCTYVTTIK